MGLKLGTGSADGAWGRAWGLGLGPGLGAGAWDHAPPRAMHCPRAFQGEFSRRTAASHASATPSEGALRGVLGARACRRLLRARRGVWRLPPGVTAVPKASPWTVGGCPRLCGHAMM